VFGVPGVSVITRTRQADSLPPNRLAAGFLFPFFFSSFLQLRTSRPASRRPLARGYFAGVAWRHRHRRVNPHVGRVAFAGQWAAESETMSILPLSKHFPPAEQADPCGLVGFGGRLSPEWLIDAYSHGIFPWPMENLRRPIPWWSPDPRAIIEFKRFHVSRRLRRTIRSGRFELTLDRDFEGVIRGCATAPGRRDQTWITPEMIRAYVKLHKLGYGHSVEAWHEGRLAGGVYGVAIAGLFAAESMFYRVSDASKAALVHLVEHLQHRGYRLLDIQQLTPHLARMGAIEIPRTNTCGDCVRLCKCRWSLAPGRDRCRSSISAERTEGSATSGRRIARR